MEVIYGLNAAIIVILVLGLIRSRSRSQLGNQQSEALKIELENLKLALGQKETELNTARTQASELSVRAAELATQLSERAERLNRLEAELDAARSAIERLQLESGQRLARISELETGLEHERRQAAEKLSLLSEAREQLGLEFNNLANRIFEEKTQKFTDQNRSNLEVVLNPLREQLGDFKKRVEDVYDKESKDRAALHGEITSLRELNRSIGQEAVNLTRALKGESKTRGNWGEVVLERVLEESGLEKGREYETQVSLTSEGGRRFQPDVIVRLPENKDVVIDSKVSLAAYERYSSAEDEAERAAALKEHINALRTHIKDLGSKNYAELPGVRSLDFVLLFVPIEAAFLTVMQHDTALFGEAYKERIVIVSPSTLLVTLKTIQYIWRNEYQNKNAQEIARQATNLYDKFVGFAEALDEVGRQLERAQKAYETAHNRLSSGSGNLVGRIQAFKKLGIAPKKDLPPSLRTADDEIDDE